MAAEVASPLWLLARKQLYKWSRSVPFKRMLVPRLFTVANQSSRDIDTWRPPTDIGRRRDGQQGLGGTAQRFLASLHTAKDA